MLLERDEAAIYRTPEELLEQIINDSKSDYDWITGPEQLYNCIHIDGFPDDIRQQIMSLIMKCYTNLETTDYLPNHQDILNEIFHELKDDEIKSNYLKAIIFEITQYDSAGLARSIDYISDLFKEKENRWKKEMYTKYWKINYNIDLKTIRGKLQIDYDDFLEEIKSNPNITIAEKEINDIINKETAVFFKEIRDIPYQGDNQY